MAKTALLALVMVSGHIAFGASWDGNEMLRYCGRALDDPTTLSSAQSMKTFVCMGYVTGTVDSIETFYSTSNSSKPKPFCLPAGGLERVHVMRVVIKWLDSNPEKLDRAAPEIITQALADEFPCK
jgi:hypothetical protein